MPSMLFRISKMCTCLYAPFPQNKSIWFELVIRFNHAVFQIWLIPNALQLSMLHGLFKTPLASVSARHGCSCGIHSRFGQLILCTLTTLQTNKYRLIEYSGWILGLCHIYIYIYENVVIFKKHEVWERFSFTQDKNKILVFIRNEVPLF